MSIPHSMLLKWRFKQYLYFDWNHGLRCEFSQKLQFGHKLCNRLLKWGQFLFFRSILRLATLEINESSCFYPKARWRDSNKFLYIDKCKYDRNKYNDSSYSRGNKLLILFVWSSFNPLLTQWMNKTDEIYFSRFFFLLRL